jgi:hypothetical protein
VLSSYKLVTKTGLAWEIAAHSGYNAGVVGCGYSGTPYANVVWQTSQLIIVLSLRGNVLECASLLVF